MVKIITIANQKGGVGKTTTAVNLSDCLSRKGFKTLLIDLDQQANATSDLLANTNFNYTVSDLLDPNSRQKVTIQECIYPASPYCTDTKNLFIIPADENLISVEGNLEQKLHKHKVLLNHIKTLTDYDYIVIDTAPSVKALVLNAIYAADFILIPVLYCKYSLDGVAGLFNTLNEVKEGTNYQYKMLICRYDQRTTKTNRAIEEILINLKDHMLNTKINLNEAIKQAQMASKPVYLYDPKCSGAEDYKNLLEEVLNVQS